MSQGFGQVYHDTSALGGSQFPGDKNKVGPQNVGSLAIQPPELVASPRIFIENKLYIYVHISTTLKL